MWPGNQICNYNSNYAIRRLIKATARDKKKLRELISSRFRFRQCGRESLVCQSFVRIRVVLGRNSSNRISNAWHSAWCVRAGVNAQYVRFVHIYFDSTPSPTQKLWVQQKVVIKKCVLKWRWSRWLPQDENKRYYMVLGTSPSCQET